MSEDKGIMHQPHNPESTKCDMCDEIAVTSHNEVEEFQYGSGENEATLSVTVPVWKCQACGFEYTDYVAEEIRHNAVCAFLGVLTPSEITLIRERFLLTRAAFAEITDIGEASLKRWENGLQIQSKSMDNLLRLAADETVFQMLKSHSIKDLPAVVPPRFKGQFRSNLSTHILKQKDTFCLRLVAA